MTALPLAGDVRPGRAAVAIAVTLGAAGIGAATAALQSPLPLIGLVGLALVVVTLARPEAATLAFMALLYTNAPTVAVKFYGAPPLLAASFTGLLAIPLAGYLLRGHRIVTGVSMPFLVALLVVATLSTMLSAHPDLGMAWLGIFVTEGILLYFLTVNVIRSPATLRRVLWTVVIAGALVGALTTYQELTGSYNESFGGFAQITSRGIDVGTDPLGTDQRQPRLAGPLGEQNRYAQVLLVLLPVAVALAQTEKRRWRQLLALGSGAFLLSATLLTYSRGAAVAIVGMLALAVVYRVVPARRVFAVLAVIAVLAILVAPAYVDRLGTLGGLEGLLGSGSGADAGSSLMSRAALAVAAWTVATAYPVLGVGPGVFAADYSARLTMETGLTYLGSGSQYPAHNLYLGIAADLGFVGLAVFLAIIVTTLIGLSRVRRHASPASARIAASLTLGVWGYLISGLFLHLSFERYFWILIAIANAAILVLGRETGEEGEAAAPQPDTSGVRTLSRSPEPSVLAPTAR